MTEFVRMLRSAFVVSGLVAAIVAAVLVARTGAPSLERPYEGRPAVIAATFSSAWCSSCRILAPRLSRVIPAFQSAPIRFVDYDFTFGATPDLRLQAANDGLASSFDLYKGATGFTLLIDAKTGRVLDRLTIAHSEVMMKDAIRRAIDLATHRDEVMNAGRN